MSKNIVVLFVSAFPMFALTGVLDYVVYGSVRHKQTGMSILSWYCGLCGYYSKKKCHVTEHMFYKHVEEENLPCKYCEMVFTKRPVWIRHMRKCVKQQLFPAPPNPF